jgi:MYXO-CTERM domain-containing protein
LGGFIKQGADRLLKARETQFGYGTYRLLVVTDGEASDRAIMKKYAPDVMARGISLDVIGVGMSSTHSLAKMAHSYRKADDAKSLARAVAEVFAEVSAKDTQASGGDDAFAAIDPLPIEVAGAMIKALTDSGNHPIGAAPPAPKPPAAPPSPAKKPTTKAPTPQPLSGGQPPPDSGCGCHAGDDAGSAPWGGLALALLLGLRRRRR